MQHRQRSAEAGTQLLTKIVQATESTLKIKIKKMYSLLVALEGFPFTRCNLQNKTSLLGEKKTKKQFVKKGVGSVRGVPIHQR